MIAVNVLVPSAKKINNLFIKLVNVTFIQTISVILNRNILKIFHYYIIYWLWSVWMCGHMYLGFRVQPKGVSSLWLCWSWELNSGCHNGDLLLILMSISAFHVKSYLILTHKENGLKISNDISHCNFLWHNLCFYCILCNASKHSHR